MFWVWLCRCLLWVLVFFFKQKTAYEMRISDWSSDVCSSDLVPGFVSGSVRGGDCAVEQFGQACGVGQGVLAALDEAAGEGGGVPRAVGPVGLVRCRGLDLALDLLGSEREERFHQLDRRPVGGGGADRKSTRLNSSH